MDGQYDAETLAKIKEAVEAVTKSEVGDLPADAPLNLDSINRITLLVELENRFQVELDSAEVQPETFDTLAALAAYVNTAAG